ncbi:MAG: YlbF family regulator [Oscillospiraceae bacterium]|nr:YlbF family regulator [Oscillospiraceae bacterium]
MDIIKMARDLGSEIQKQEIYLDMIRNQAKNDEDQGLQELIGEFNLKRMALNSQMSKEETEKDKDKIDNLDKEVRDLYQKIMNNNNMINYNKSRQALTALMADINKILSAAVTGQDPQTVSLEETGCSGSCSSCGGCH